MLEEGSMSRRGITPVLLLAFGIAVLASPAAAVTLGKGTSMLAIQLTNGTADLVSTEDLSGYIYSFTQPELGVQAEYWRLMSDDYALAIAAGAGWFSETEKPGTNALPTDPEFKYTSSSWHVRVGGDRVVSIGERALFYFGPGFEFWSGKDKVEGGGGSLESQSVKRFSFSGRLGATMTLGPNWGLTCHIGRVVGYATAEDAGAKATWWPSSFDAAGGLTFLFGGAK
jgi:hypothetical protein